jgi:hypothetical protein
MGLVAKVRMGAYPEDPYYDPNRPSWLPYWIDTPTESYRKYKYYLYELPATADKPYPDPNPPPAPSSPSSLDLEHQLRTGDVGSFTPADQLNQDRSAWNQWRQTAIPETPLEALRRQEEEEKKRSEEGGLPLWAWLLIIGGGALALVVALKPNMPSVSFGSR